MKHALHGIYIFPTFMVFKVIKRWYSTENVYTFSNVLEKTHGKRDLN
jgi:hypothetical protein